jgi:5-formyltetrahydrofolate cyclo-ligase
MLTKQQIRSKILLRLKSQKEENRSRKSKVIGGKLYRTKVFKKAKTIMFYIAFRGEVDTTEMIEKARKLGKKVTVPVCRKNRVTISPCILDHNARFKKGPYGVCEPVKRTHINLDDLDLVIVPGLAFDAKGNRIGRGKGCYDRFLSLLKKGTPSIGLAFDFQLFPALPSQTHDISVDKVLFA